MLNITMAVPNAMGKMAFEQEWRFSSLDERQSVFTLVARTSLKINFLNLHSNDSAGNRDSALRQYLK